jgi:serine/threonine protein kinase
VLVRGSGGKADVFAIAVDGSRILVKDFSPRGAWARLLGRLQIAREAAAYGWLAGVAGVPSYVGRIDAFALAIEWIDGERLAFAEVRPLDGPPLVAKLRAVVDRIHARGVVHNDLRGRENVLLRQDGDLTVIDFAAAVRLRPGGLAYRVAFRFLAMADEAAFLKWKGMLAPGSYTAQDEAFLKRFEMWRAMWPFNPKRRKSARVA